MSLKQPLIAFVLRRGRVVSVGFNSYTKTHPKQKHYATLAGQPNREYLHAELAALLRAPRDSDTLMVVRLNKAGDPVCAKPCPVCVAAIHHFNPNLNVIHS